MEYSNEPLSDLERDQLRDCICAPTKLGFRPVTSKLLKDTSAKTPAEARAMIAVWKAAQTKAIDDQIAALLNKKDKLI